MSNYSTRKVMITNVYTAFSVYKGLLQLPSSLIPAITLEGDLQHRKGKRSPEMLSNASKVTTGKRRTKIKSQVC